MHSASTVFDYFRAALNSRKSYKSHVYGKMNILKVQGLNVHSIYEGIGRYAQLVEQVIGPQKMFSYILDKRKKAQLYVGTVMEGLNLPFTNGWYFNIKLASFFLRKYLEQDSVIHSMSPNLVPKDAELVTIHDMDYLSNFKNKISHNLTKKTLDYAIETKNILTVSKQTERSLQQYGARNIKRIDLCALPVFRKLTLRKDELRRKYKIPIDKTIILTVGHGKTELVDEAVRKAGFFHVHIGRERADLNILGPSNEELNEIYNCSDVFVRITEVEGFGFPAMEASTVGIPIVVSDIQTYRDIYGNSAVYTEPDSDFICEAIKEAFNGKDELTSNFDRIRDHYSFQRFADEMNAYYSAVYESSLKER